MPNSNKMRFGMIAGEAKVVGLTALGFVLTAILFFQVLSMLGERNATIATLFAMSGGFGAKFIIFGWAAIIMFSQQGTSKLAIAVKWFFVTMSVQDVIVSLLYGAAAVDALDGSTDLSITWRTATRALGVESVFMVAAVGIFFILVLRKRVRVLVEYVEVDGVRSVAEPDPMARRMDTRYEGEENTR